MSVLLAILGMLLVPGVVIFGLVALAGIKQLWEYEKGVKFRLGRYHSQMGPGLNYVIPFIEKWVRIDTRIFTVDIPNQDVITKDNIPANINAVIYFKVKNPEKSVLAVRDYHYAISKYAQTSLRNMAGEVTLDELLSQRDSIAKKLEQIVDEATNPWGLDVTGIELQDIQLPEMLRRTMAKQAEAEREKRAVIIKAEGEVAAAVNLSKAAAKYKNAEAALFLRTLETINHLSPEKSKTNIYAIPVEVLRAVEKYSEDGGGK
ncbi:SPFH domain-containing protein [archaeon]|nr:SPFH domain-containing protein [archaeon]